MIASCPITLLAFLSVFAFYSVESLGLVKSDKAGFSYAAFKMNKNLYLNVTRSMKMKQTIATDLFDCIAVCLGTSGCLSCNFDTQLVDQDHHQCELLTTDMFNSSKKLVESQNFSHLSIESPCFYNACANGGSCVAKYEQDDYECVCTSGYTGRNCEQDIDECANTTVCGADTDCINTAGSYHCICKIGCSMNATGNYTATRIGLDNSTILNGNSSLTITLRHFLPKDFNNSRWARCWRAASDGPEAATFHSNCDKKGPTVTIIKVGENVFGGFANKSWDGEINSFIRDPEAFLFSLENNDNLSPFKMTPRSNALFPGKSLHSYQKYGPIFGCSDFFIADMATRNKHSNSDLGCTYQLPHGYRYNTATAHALLAGSRYFTPTDVEVFYYLQITNN